MSSRTESTTSQNAASAPRPGRPGQPGHSGQQSQSGQPSQSGRPNQSGRPAPSGPDGQSSGQPRAGRFRWRVVDIVVASVLGVAAGIVFWAWGLGWSAISAPMQFLPGLQASLATLWVAAGVLGALVIRKPGAAIFVETVAAAVSALVGTQWGGFLTIEAGIVQGLGAEIIFLLFVYRAWNLPVAMLAGAGAGAAMAINDLIFWYPGSGAAFIAVYAVSAVIGGAVIAGLLPWLAVKGLARTGALSRFASGRASTRRV